MYPKTQNTILFFDDQRLSLRSNMRRRLGRPKLIQESVYVDPYRNLHFCYPFAFQNRENNEWFLVYQGNNTPGPNEKRVRVPLVARSTDGINWTPFDTTALNNSFDRELKHQLFSNRNFGEMSAVFYDSRAQESQRFKALVMEHLGNRESTTHLWTSPDLLHWNLQEHVRWQAEATDPNTSVFWNEVRQSYVIISRPAFGDRRLCAFETNDWRSFSYEKRELIFQADSQDLPMTEIYGMPVIPYKGYYIGLMWLFHTVQDYDYLLPYKYLNGHVECQLAYSLNGWHFQRTLREPFIGNDEPGSRTAGCVYPTCMVDMGSEGLRLYAGACSLEHGWNVRGTGSVLAYKMREDGFIFLESESGYGVIRTRLLDLGDSVDISVNLECPNGEAVACVIDFADPEKEGAPLHGYSYDDCQPFVGDSISWRPEWKNGNTVKNLSGKTIMLEIRIRNGRIYSINGSFIVITGRAYRDHEGKARSVGRLHAGF